MTALNKPNSILGWAGWVGGAALGWYAGMHLLIPLALTLGASWAMNKFLKKQNPYLTPAAMQVGHMMWIGFGLLVTGQWNHLNVGDCIILATGVVWLLARPGLP